MGITDYLVVEWSPTTDPLAAPDWEDITSYVRNVGSNRSFGSLIDSFSAGRCTVVANNGTKTAAGWINGNDSAKWRRMRIRAVDSSWFVFSGFIRNTVHTWDQAPHQRLVTFELTDLWGLFANSTVDGVDTYFAGPVGEVFQASYDNKPGWVTNGGALDVATWVLGKLGVVVTASDAHCHEYLFVPSDLRGPALSTLATYLDAALERVEVGSDGNVYYRGRWDATIGYTDEVPPVFSDDQTIDVGSYRYLRGTLPIAPLDRDYYDVAVIQGVEGDPYTQGQAATDWPESAYTRTSSPIADQNWSRATAAAVVEMSSSTETFPNQISCLIAGPKATAVDGTHPSLQNVLGVCNVVQNAVPDGPYVWFCSMLSVSHDIDAKQGWKATLGLSDVGFTRLDDQGGGLFQLGVSTLAGGKFFAP